MSYDDFDVIVYKTLAYIYTCLKQGVEPNLYKAQEIANCNDLYWKHVISSMLSDGYITGIYIPEYLDKKDPVIFARNLGITQKGASYVSENSKMAEVRKFLGKAFEKILALAITSTQAL